MACCPMRGAQRYRIIIIKGRPPGDNNEVRLEELLNNVSSLSLEPIKISDVSWLTRFSIHHRMTEHFQKGAVFLAGDAAHIHSPVGGQGMNTGIQDALNLAHRFARVLLGGASRSDLRSYEKDRIPVARRILKGTDIVSRFGVLQRNSLALHLRETFLPILLRSRLVQERVATAVSQVKIARGEIQRRAAEGRVG
jgi:3-(3-hydroxy-phenyl)propionate hydroxylase